MQTDGEIARKRALRGGDVNSDAMPYRMGLTPTDRSKVAVSKEKPKNVFSNCRGDPVRQLVVGCFEFNRLGRQISISLCRDGGP
jgi:hypothetical protein